MIYYDDIISIDHWYFMSFFSRYRSRSNDKTIGLEFQATI